MNQQSSSGLPLRAMVMVLLFLGVAFLLVALQAMGGGDDEGEQSPLATTSVTTSSSPSKSAEPARPEVRVFNISTVQGAAEGAANRLRDGGWTVAQTGNLVLPDVTVNTVYFTDAPGEREAAEEVGKLLDATVEPRLPELAEQPPGVLVVVTG
jgi:hypothetical protein